MAERERPDIKVLYVWRAEVATTWGILFGIALIIAICAVTLAGSPKWIIALAAIPLAWGVISLFFLKIRWERWTFELTPFTLEMSHGWIYQRRRVVSRNRIQHVDFASGPVGRKFDLVHVVVHTAGAVVGTIPGIPSKRADLLRDELMSGPKTL
jgi:membrane protein YdbS with pleckstrin-like domain